MPVIDYLVNHLVADEVGYRRNGVHCDQCLPVTPCKGHYTLDGEPYTGDEYDELHQTMERRLVKAFVSADWDRVMSGAWGYSMLRDADLIEAVDIFLAFTEPTTSTDPEEHMARMREVAPHLFELPSARREAPHALDLKAPGLQPEEP